MIRHAIACAAAITTGVLLASPATAGLPGSVKSEHPRLYGTKADFDRIRHDAALETVQFPARKGKLKFTITPVPRGLGDDVDANIFGAFNGSGDRLVIRHADVGTDPVQSQVRLQIGGRRAGAAWTFGTMVTVTPGEPVDVEVAFDADDKVTIKVGSAAPYVWTAAGSGWSTKDQTFEFRGHRGDIIRNFELRDAAGAVVWQSANVDLELRAGWKGLLATATRQAAEINGCTPSAAPPAKPELCDTTSGGRGRTTEAAKRIALAYRFTGKEEFLRAARNHIALMRAVPLIAGGEWSMSARVGALGIYYDWINDAFKGTDEGRALAKLITDTIAADKPGSNDDLIASICGAQGLSTDASRFDCNVKPVFTNWNRAGNAPTIAPFYVGGHHASAATGSVLGLLAIGDELQYAKVLPMIDTIYDHFALGFLPARETYGPDGGNHTLFSYGSGSGEVSDRLVMWRRALNLKAGQAGLQSTALTKAIYPFIYGLRHDQTFPARGDNYEFYLNYPGMGSMVLAAVQAGDPVPLDFYRRITASRHRESEYTVWERLLYPHATPAQATPDLPLSRHFKSAGNVLMRDTWDYPNATLLEFKSSSFISENHQHLDQNSFSLNYKAPLLLDSGQYDEYATGHWFNYHQRTIAHNAIVVYDSSEHFAQSGFTWGNDGGQWYDGRPTYPTIEEIRPGGTNALAGVTAHEEAGWYAYVSADATLAYKRGKLSTNGGAVRSIVYLRPPGNRNGSVEPPTILVFDRVQPTGALYATSLLHMVDKPAASGTPGLGLAGRYAYNFGTAKPLFTVRNGEGMVTVQPLLPANPAVVLSGGKDEGSKCKQVIYVKDAVTNRLVRTPEPDGPDCRFLIREDGTDTWVNHRPLDATNVTPDVGNWRLEITPNGKLSAGAAQYFLNALHVADNDHGNAVVSTGTASLLTSSSGAVAVLTADGTAVVFNDSALTPAALYWKPGSGVVKTLVVGLVKNGFYKWETASTGQVTLTPVAAGSSGESGVKQASAQGTLNL